MTAIRWETAGRVVLDGLSSEQAQDVADRWCGATSPVEAFAGSGIRGEGSESRPHVQSHRSDLEQGPTAVLEREPALRLVIPVGGDAPASPEPKRIRIGVRVPANSEALEVRVGPHAIVTGSGADPDVIRFSSRRQPSRLEFALLVDMGINHLLARQGLPVLHACSFELEDVSVLGLGEGFSGKSTVSVAALSAGGQVVSDDVVLAVPGHGEELSVLPLRTYGWLRGRTREIVPKELQGKMVEGAENGQPRWTLYREDGSGRFVDTTSPNAIWVQSVDRRLKESRIEPVDQGTVFSALIRANSPVFVSRHCPETRDKLIPVFRALCEQCRGFRVRLGRRLMDDPVGEMERLVELSR